MKKTKADDLQAQYDFSTMNGAVRGKYAARYKAGTNVVLLDADVYKAFPDSKSVNKALRALLKIASAIPSPSAKSQR